MTIFFLKPNTGSWPGFRKYCAISKILPTSFNSTLRWKGQFALQLYLRRWLVSQILGYYPQNITIESSSYKCLPVQKRGFQETAYPKDRQDRSWPRPRPNSYMNMAGPHLSIIQICHASVGNMTECYPEGGWFSRGRSPRENHPPEGKHSIMLPTLAWHIWFIIPNKPRL